MTEVDIEHLRKWIGKSERRQEVLCVERAASLAVTLDHERIPELGDALPPLWHWAFFVPTARKSELGLDGHPKLGGFMPPVPLPRRMWVGSRLQFANPVRLGETVSRTTKITDVIHKTGKNGALVFITLRHEIGNSAAVCIIEEQDLVYRREAKAPSQDSKPVSALGEAEARELPADWREPFTPDPVLLFRYSAITFNAHRIHYDARYAVEEENYPGLVVQGPLTALLLVDRLGRHTARKVREFRFRAARPLFCGREMRICGKRSDKDTYELWSETPGGYPSMTARAIVA